MMKRYGRAIKIKPERFEEYKKIHSEVWPEVLKTITECNIKNFSIYHKDGWLFSYFEYMGNDFEKDMRKMAKDPVSQKWQEICGDMQIPPENRKDGEWWAVMEEVFHQG